MFSSNKKDLHGVFLTESTIPLLSAFMSVSVLRQILHIQDNGVFPIRIFSLNSLNSLNSTKLKLCKTYLLYSVAIKILFPLANYKELSVLKE